MGRPARLAAGAVFVPGAVAGAGMRSGASRDAFPSGAWERHRRHRGGGALLRLFRGRLRERECEAELRGTHSQAELGNDTDDTEGAGRFCVCSGGGCGSGGMLLTTGVVMRRRAATGVDGTRVKALWFFGGGDFFTGSGASTHCVLPMDRQDEGFLFSARGLWRTAQGRRQK